MIDWLGRHIADITAWVAVLFAVFSTLEEITAGLPLIGRLMDIIADPIEFLGVWLVAVLCVLVTIVQRRLRSDRLR